MNLAMSAWNSSNGLRNVNAYDEDMRLIGIRVPNLQSWDYGYDTANRINTITDNLDGTLSETLGYDELDRLTTVTSTADNESYVYDADGNRLSANLNGTPYGQQQPAGFRCQRFVVGIRNDSEPIASFSAATTRSLRATL